MENSRNGRLTGKVAIITGAADGIGKAAAQKFIAEGGNVVIFDIQEDKGRVAANEIGASFVQGDIRREEDFAEAVRTAIDIYGGLDVMYHNAAVPGSPSKIEDISVDDWDDSQAMLVRASILAIKASIPAMRARGGGSIILTSSASAYNYRPYAAPVGYVVGKGAVIHLGRAAALQYAAENIRVNTIAPGGVASAIHLKNLGFDQVKSDAVAKHLNGLYFERYQPLPLAGKAEYIADTALFLASDDSRWITGIDINVDGGLALYRPTTDDEYMVALQEAERLADLDLNLNLND